MTGDTRNHIAVVGVGNLLYGDDGFGVHVIEKLRCETLPEGIDLIDGGSIGVDLLDYLTAYRHVIVIDCADMSLAPGALRVFRPEEVRSLEKGAALSLHSTDVLGVIELGKALGETLADIHIIAAQAEFVGPHEGLSPPVAGALNEAMQEVRRIIRTMD